MGNLALSFLIMAGFFGFLLIVSHLATLQLYKNWKLHRSNKAFDGTRSGHKPKPLYIQRSKADAIYDIDSCQEWQDLGVLSPAKRSTYREKFKDNRETNS